MKPLSKQEHKSADCAIELTKLNVKGKEWWTLGFDIYGKTDKVVGILHGSVDSLLKTYSEPKLEVSNSYGYPEWILKIID